MPLVPITFRVYGPSHDPIPEEFNPRLFVRLAGGSDVGDGLLAEVEKEAVVVNGVGSVEVDSFPGAQYQFVLEWTIPSSFVPPEKWARRRTVWPPFFPGPGGDISALAPFAGMRGVVGGFGPVDEWPHPVVYLDLADPDGIGVYGPAGMLATEGGA